MGKCPACNSNPKVKVYFAKEFNDKEAAEIEADAKPWQAGQDFHDDIHKALGEENS
jgi:hypothetical protein